MSQRTIALIDMSNEQADAFSIALKLCTTDWKLVDDLNAELLVVDTDISAERFNGLRSQIGPGQQLAAYSSRKNLVEHALVLEKPLYSNRLESFLKLVSTQMAHKDAAMQSDASLPESCDKSLVVRESLGSTLLAGAIPTPMRVQVNGIEMLLDPERDAYHSNSALKPLSALLALPVDAARPLDAAGIESMRDTPALPVCRLQWLAALCATPGQLSVTLDPQAAYRLIRWPQIEREFPHHFRIATAMFKQAGTLQEIAAAANAAVENVADFINAYCTSGHVQVENAHAMPDAQSGAAHSGVDTFLKWRRHFKRNSGSRADALEGTQAVNSSVAPRIGVRAAHAL